MRQSFYCQFHILSWKMWVCASDFKHRHIKYRWKIFFATSMNKDYYLKIKFHLAWINYQSLSFFTEKCADDPSTFHKRRVPLWRVGHNELFGAQFGHWNWPETIVPCWSQPSPLCKATTAPLCCLGSQASCHSFGAVWVHPTSMCSEIVAEASQSSVGWVELKR